MSLLHKINYVVTDNVFKSVTQIRNSEILMLCVLQVRTFR